MPYYGVMQDLHLNRWTLRVRAFARRAALESREEVVAISPGSFREVLKQ